jgi:hypothetical protein
MSIEYRYFKQGTMDIKEFHKLYELSFHKKNENIIPANTVLIYDDKKYVGFLDLTILSKTAVYLKYIGFSKFDMKLLKYCKGAFEHIQNDLGYKFISASIDTKNRLALLWAIKAGFIIHGFKVQDGSGYVEIIRNGAVSGSYRRGL